MKNLWHSKMINHYYYTILYYTILHTFALHFLYFPCNSVTIQTKLEQIESNAHLSTAESCKRSAERIFRAMRNSFFGGPGVLFTFCRWLEVLEFNRQSGGFNPTSSNFELQPTAAAPTTSLRFPTSLFKRRQCWTAAWAGKRRTTL